MPERVSLNEWEGIRKQEQDSQTIPALQKKSNHPFPPPGLSPPCPLCPLDPSSVPLVLTPPPLGWCVLSCLSQLSHLEGASLRGRWTAHLVLVPARRQRTGGVSHQIPSLINHCVAAGISALAEGLAQILAWFQTLDVPTTHTHTHTHTASL